MKVTLLSLYMKNFKGVRERTISFGQTLTEISGKNGTGKSSIYDAFEWLLHNTNSLGLTDKGVNAFSRPRNADGSLVNDVEVSVTASMVINDKPCNITKTQKQKFARVRGTDQTVFKGNENTYEIDGIPKKEAEFTAFIENIIDPETFKLLTNPDYFMDLPNDDVKGKKGKMSLLLELCARDAALRALLGSAVAFVHVSAHAADPALLLFRGGVLLGLDVRVVVSVAA